MKLNILGIPVSILLISGLFGPWIIKGLNEHVSLNPQTGKVELQYRRMILLSPLFGAIQNEGSIVQMVWFASVGLSFSSLILISAAVLNLLHFGKDWVNFIPFITAVMGIFMFFMSLGMGQEIGVSTFLGWGLIATSIAVISMFTLSIFKIIIRTSLRL